MALRVDQWPLIQQLLSLPILYLIIYYKLKKTSSNKPKKRPKKKQETFKPKKVPCCELFPQYPRHQV